MFCLIIFVITITIFSCSRIGFLRIYDAEENYHMFFFQPRLKTILLLPRMWLWTHMLVSFFFRSRRSAYFIKQERVYKTKQTRVPPLMWLWTHMLISFFFDHAEARISLSRREFTRQNRHEHSNRLTNKPTRPKRPATAITAAQQRKNRARKLAHKDPDKRENRNTKQTRSLSTRKSAPSNRAPSFVKPARYQASASSLINNARRCAGVEVP